MAECRKKFARCFVYYQTGIGYSPWQKKVNANGGNDPNGYSNTDSANANAAAAAMVAGIANGIAASRGINVAPAISSPIVNNNGGQTFGLSGGSCDSANVEASIARLKAQTGLGICNMARQEAGVFRQAAAMYRRCGQTQNANSMEGAASQADATASQACVN
ncbi:MULTISPECIES: hypothetical protein [unclassified Rhizobium]|uniref:hypothetical protein n=1 Tax=unclassified Rhizobium TaxID=2613769 RepID=UPI001ADD314E|nr:MULTISPECIES: hypothetical protein [unclassified Rhizobium]MBO9099389.1 hypothetical protein [Rhizobium sp. L58/93]MBO9188126.1 hypothetical protein [Rhizobium sp. E27B/91]QXZ82357.1 hypothetical protein J5287_09550 [Rhizobium sp. K1/93]QXZ90130.1 hypothetical protein J5280_00450 [Rhizobium sp. K15/93]QYA02667.1 hypothetical protein J5278_05710 [Rhizobium sp. B21/90]